MGAVTYDSFPGLYYSNDAGQTWQMATIQDGTTIVQTPQPLGTAGIGNAATSVVWDPVRANVLCGRPLARLLFFAQRHAWTRLTTQPGTALTTANCPVGANGVGSANCPIYRGSLAVQAATGDLYALTVDANNLDQGLWQDLCSASSGSCAKPAPTFANRIDNCALEIGSGSTAIAQGSYNLALSAVPAAANSTNLYVGTVDLYRCAIAAGSSSCTLRNTTNALDGCNAPAQVAAAQHAIATVAQTSGVPILFLGNDSGLWRSLDGVCGDGRASVRRATPRTSTISMLRSALADRSSETVGFAQNPGSANILIAGLGANGSAATSTANALTPGRSFPLAKAAIPRSTPLLPPTGMPRSASA